MNFFSKLVLLVLLVTFSFASTFLLAAEAAANSQGSSSLSVLVKSLKPLKLSGVNCGYVDLGAIDDAEVRTPEEFIERIATQSAFVCLGKKILKEGCKSAYLRAEKEGEWSVHISTKKKGKTCTLVQEMKDDAVKINGVTKATTVRTTCSVAAMNNALTKEDRSLLKRPGNYTATIFFGILFMNTFTLMGLGEEGKGATVEKGHPCKVEVLR